MKILETILKIIRTKQIYTPIIAIFLGIIACRGINSALQKIMKLKDGKNSYEQKKKRTIIDLCSNIFKYVVIVIVAVIILDAYGIDTKSIIAGLGVLSAVLGLALRDTLKDFVGGVSIILENYYVVGDFVTFGTFTGEVIELGLKSTKIKNFNGEILILANRNVNQVINLSQAKQNIFLEVSVAYEEPTEKVETSLKKIMPEIEKINYVVKKSVAYLGISSLGDSAVTYLLKIQSLPDKQWQVKRDALRIIKNTFEEDNIKIPYPQIEVHHGQDI